ncbi:MAG: DUF1425 domain-containing protein [Methylococcaceae bacterium]
MNKNSFLKLCYFALIAVLFAGCATQPLSPPAPNSIASKVILLNELPRISIYDLRMVPINNFLVVEAELVHNDTFSDTVLKSAPWFTTLPVLIVGAAVQPMFSSRASSSNSIQYRFQWRDKNGMNVGSEESWKVLNFIPSQAQHIRGVATSKYAVDFKLELKNNN